MKKLLVIIFFANVWLKAAGQVTQYFNLSTPGIYKVANSFYRTITVLDVREDKSYGTILKKTKEIELTPEVPLSEQVDKIMRSLIDSTTNEGELLLVLRQLRFTEVPKGAGKIGLFRFKGSLFVKEGSAFNSLSTIDTVIDATGFDVTKKLFSKAGNLVASYLALNLLKLPNHELRLNINQFAKIDSFEKRRIPLYNVTTYADGIYYSYQSLANQQPDEIGISVIFDKKGSISDLRYTMKNGQKMVIKPAFVYAVIFNGKPHISGEFSTYPLERKEDDFYYTGKVLDAKAGDVAMAQFFFGIMGGLMASSATSIYEMKLDHFSGKFVPVRKIGK